MTPHMVLVGLSGAGKSTAGKRASELAGMPFVDLDDEISKAAGKSIAAIFDGEGEEAFRALETEATERVLAWPPSVIAAGAGWIASARNRSLLLSRGRIIYLRVGAGTAANRLEVGHSRPKLAGGATIEMLRRMEAERSPYYESADAVLDTEGLTLQQVTQGLADLIQVIKGEK